MNDYAKFLDGKAQFSTASGFKPLWMPNFLYDFQASLVDWALHQGRAALFEDCGLGKTPQQLVWAENVVRKTNKPVLVLTPLAVAGQTHREAEKFSIDSTVSRDGKFTGKRVVITNYERLHHFNPEDFGGVVADESSAIKNFEGERQKVVTEFMRKHPYRLLCTATASPNDYIELGTSSEALGELGRMDMLSMFFKNDENSNHPIWWGARWRFKAHAEEKFWRRVTSWARALRRPSDLGFDYWARYAIWKEPLRTAIRTRSKGLMHRQIVKDSSLVNNAGADYLLVFRKPGENKEPLAHPVGLTKYCGEREIPDGLAEKYRDWKDPKTNKLAHWIWQQYASSFWDDIRIGRTLSYKEARASDEEKHCHPLQLDVIERCVLLWTNPGDVVATPFMGVGSEVYGAVVNGRKGLGVELKPSYFRQAVKNVGQTGHEAEQNDMPMFAADAEETEVS